MKGEGPRGKNGRRSLVEGGEVEMEKVPWWRRLESVVSSDACRGGNGRIGVSMSANEPMLRFAWTSESGVPGIFELHVYRQTDGVQPREDINMSLVLHIPSPLIAIIISYAMEGWW